MDILLRTYYLSLSKCPRRGVCQMTKSHPIHDIMSKIHHERLSLDVGLAYRIRRRDPPPPSFCKTYVARYLVHRKPVALYDPSSLIHPSIVHSTQSHTQSLSLSHSLSLSLSKKKKTHFNPTHALIDFCRGSISCIVLHCIAVIM